MTGPKAGRQGETERGKRPPKRVDPAELAAILAFAATHTDRAAAAKFGISIRTISRHREAIRDGKAPELAQLVADQKNVVAARCADLLTETYEQSLRRLQEILPSATGQLALDAAKKLGELRITRGVLGEPDTDAPRGRVATATAPDRADQDAGEPVH